MNTSPCDQLDGYLADWLSETQRAAYEVHLANCHMCRYQINLQRHIDSLLVQGIGQLEPLSLSLVDSLVPQIHLLQHRRNLRLVWGLTAAAIVVIMAGVWSVLQQSSPLIGSLPIAQKQDAPVGHTQTGAPPARLVSQPKSLVRVTPSDPSTAILVPVAMENPNVTFVWLYPTVKPTLSGNGVEAN